MVDQGQNDSAGSTCDPDALQHTADSCPFGGDGGGVAAPAAQGTPATSCSGGCTVGLAGLCRDACMCESKNFIAGGVSALVGGQTGGCVDLSG